MELGSFRAYIKRGVILTC